MAKFKQGDIIRHKVEGYTLKIVDDSNVICYEVMDDNDTYFSFKQIINARFVLDAKEMLQERLRNEKNRI